MVAVDEAAEVVNFIKLHSQSGAFQSRFCEKYHELQVVLEYSLTFSFIGKIIFIFQKYLSILIILLFNRITHPSEILSIHRVISCSCFLKGSLSEMLTFLGDNSYILWFN